MTDSDAGDTATFALVTGTGSADNASFSISGSELQTAESFNFEVKDSYSIRLRVTDAGGLSFEKQFTISISNVNEPPSFSGYSFQTSKNTSTTVLLAKLLAKTSDPEGTARSITAVDSTSAQGGAVQLIGNAIRYAPPADYAGSDSFQVTITDGVNSISGTLSVTVTTGSGNGPTLLGISPVGSDVQLRFAGIPGRSYQVQHTTALDGSASWTTLTTATASSSGFINYTHLSPPSPSYWGAVLVP